MKLNPLGVKPLTLEEALDAFRTRSGVLASLHHHGIISSPRLRNELCELRQDLERVALSLAGREPSTYS